MGKVSQAGFNFLVAEEGFKTVAYQLSYKKKGHSGLYTEPYCTVGVGHYDSKGELGIVKGKDYGVDFCIQLFKRDATGSIAKAVNAVWDGSRMNQCQYDAMLSFAWNCGGGGFNSALKPYIQKWLNKKITDGELAGIWQTAKCTTASHYKRRKKECNYFFSDPSQVQGSDNYNITYSKASGTQGYAIGVSSTVSAQQMSSSVLTDGGMNTYTQLMTVTPPAKVSGEHTRIYKYIDSAIKLDEFSMPVNGGETAVDQETGLHEGDTISQSNDELLANLKPSGTGVIETMGPGIQYPAIQINDWVCGYKDIVGLELINSAFIPTIKLEILTTGTHLMKKDLCKEGDHINIFIAPGHGMLKSIRMDFVITWEETPKFKQYDLKGLYPYTIFGELNIPGLYDNGTSFAFVGTSRDALIDVCKKLNLGFFFCDPENTDDSQMWYCMAETEDDETPALVDYMQSVIRHSWKNEYSFFNGWIDFRYALTFVNVNKLLGESGQEEGFDITFYNTIFTQHRTSDGLHGTKSDQEKKENPVPQVKVITNIPQDEDSATAFYAIDFEIVDRAQEVTKEIGTQMETVLGMENNGLEGGQQDLGMSYSIVYNPDKYNPQQPLAGGFYIMMGPGTPENHKNGENDSYVLTNTKIYGAGAQQQPMSDGDMQTIASSGSNMQASGNTNKFYDSAEKHNYINNMQLWKKYMKVTLNGANFALMRGEKIPVIMLDNNKLQSFIGSNATDESDALPASEQEKVYRLNSAIFTDESGWFIIQSVTYEYDPDTVVGTSKWKTKLILTRREWPIPNYYSPYSSTQEGTAQSGTGNENADAATTVNNEINVGGESETQHESDSDGANTSANATDGLKDYMVELFNMIQQKAEQVGGEAKLVGGRRWAVDENGDKVDGAQAYVATPQGTKLVVVDANNTLTTLSTSQKNNMHLSGEAIDIVNGNGMTLDDLLTKVLLVTPGILKIMYDNGLSCIKEQSVQSGTTTSHLHVGIASGKEKAWWDAVQAMNGGSADIKSDSLNFSVSGYAANLKSQPSLSSREIVQLTQKQFTSIKNKWKALKSTTA